MYSEVQQGKPRLVVASDKSIYRWYLELVVKRLRCINLLNTWASICVTFKSYVVVLSFYIKLMKRRTLYFCSLKHSIKKTCFLFRAIWNYLRGMSPPSPSFPLCYAPANNETMKITSSFRICKAIWHNVSCLFFFRKSTWKFLNFMSRIEA